MLCSISIACVPSFDQRVATAWCQASVVPVDDNRYLFFHVWWDAEKKFGEEPLREGAMDGSQSRIAASLAFALQGSPSGGQSPDD